MKTPSLFCFIVALLIAGCTIHENCADGINKLPMYGIGKKCNEQIEFDKIFLKDCDKSFKSRKIAAAHMVTRGWQYFHAKKFDTSMMRFNQAWLLDTANAEIYWGFGNLLGMQKQFKESLPLFKKSLKIDSTNSKAWQDMSISYGNIFFETKIETYLDSSIYATKKAIKLDSHNAQLYSQLTGSYSYFMQKDSAKKYLKITEQLDPNAVNPEVKKLLSNK
jgi:tetratricopeptide (TPR) repeat protein